MFPPGTNTFEAGRFNFLHAIASCPPPFVLIVEDHHTTAAVMMTRLVRARGFRVLIAASLTEARGLSRGNPIAVANLDDLLDLARRELERLP